MSSPETLTNEEINKLYEYMKLLETQSCYEKKIVRNSLIVLLMLEAGLRVSEVTKILFADLYYNFEPVKSIEITPEVAKNGVPRLIPVSERLSVALKNYRTHVCPQPWHPAKAFLIYRGNPLGPITTRQAQRIVARLSIYAFGRRIHPHILRHTFASRLMRKTNSRVVQELLGHKSLTTTQVYTHPNHEDLKNAIDSV